MSITQPKFKRKQTYAARRGSRFFTVLGVYTDDVGPRQQHWYEVKTSEDVFKITEKRLAALADPI